jgi:predicted aldo/keto reductase-like oxidoreductase
MMRKLLPRLMEPDGSLQTCKETRKQGLFNFMGITGHKRQVLTKTVESGEFDTVLVPLNVVNRQALEELVPVANNHHVGVVIMKPCQQKPRI